MTDRARLEKALIAADRAGDTTAAQKLAAALRPMPHEQQQPEPVQAPQPPAPRQPIGDAADVILDPVRSIGSSALATPIAGLAGLATAGANAAGLTDANPADIIERTMGAMTYQPRTRAGE